MQQYIGTRIVKAKPITKAEYANGRLTMQEDEFTGEEGYMVEYPNGRISWVYKDLFEETYRKTSGMSFGLAIEAMKKGWRVARTGWNGKGMYAYLIPEHGVNPVCLPYIAMKTVDGKIVPWLASQTDMLADDWFMVSQMLMGEHV